MVVVDCADGSQWEQRRISLTLRPGFRTIKQLINFALQLAHFSVLRPQHEALNFRCG
jgi:hypothetical protein